MEDRSVPVSVGSTTYRLLYTFGSLRWLKDTHGLVVADFEKVADDWTVLTPFLLAGLRHSHKELGLDELDEQLTPDKFLACVEAVTKALDASGVSDADVPLGKPRTSTGPLPSVSPTAA